MDLDAPQMEDLNKKSLALHWNPVIVGFAGLIGALSGGKLGPPFRAELIRNRVVGDGSRNKNTTR
jgi:hypothetical protein